MKKSIVRKFRKKYNFLSNFAHSPIRYQGLECITAEHLFQALKTKSKITRKRIKNAPTAREAKIMGRNVTLREDWEEIKNKLMYMIVRLKFIQNPRLGVFLLETETCTIVEENYWHDN